MSGHASVERLLSRNTADQARIPDMSVSCLPNRPPLAPVGASPVSAHPEPKDPVIPSGARARCLFSPSGLGRRTRREAIQPAPLSARNRCPHTLVGAGPVSARNRCPHTLVGADPVSARENLRPACVTRPPRTLVREDGRRLSAPRSQGYMLTQVWPYGTTCGTFNPLRPHTGAAMSSPPRRNNPPRMDHLPSASRTP